MVRSEQHPNHAQKPVVRNGSDMVRNGSDVIRRVFEEDTQWTELIPNSEWYYKQ